VATPQRFHGNAAHRSNEENALTAKARTVDRQRITAVRKAKHRAPAA